MMDTETRGRKAWPFAFFLVGTVGGAVLAAHAPWDWLKQIGHGAVVASIVGAVWHLPEMTDFFAKFAGTVMRQRSFMSEMKETALKSWRSDIAGVLVASYVTNRDYDWRGFHDWMEDVTLSRCLPVATSTGVYRQGYRETITVRFVLLRKLLEELKADASAVPSADLDKMMAEVRCDIETEYVAPGDGVITPMKFDWSTADPHFIPPDKLASFETGTSWETLKPVSLKSEDMPVGGTRVHGQSAQPLWLPSTKVVQRAVWRQSALIEPFLLNLMGCRTKGLDVHFSLQLDPSVSEHLDDFGLDGWVVGMSGGIRPGEYPAQITLRDQGWVLEDQGYMIYWWPRRRRS